MADSFFTTRPRLASYMLSAGYPPTKVRNPYDPSRPAWTISLTDGSAQVVQEYCQQNQIEVPKQVRQYIQQTKENRERWRRESKERAIIEYQIQDNKRRHFNAFLYALGKKYPDKAEDRAAWEENHFGLFYVVLRDNEEFCDNITGPELDTDNEAYRAFVEEVWDTYMEQEG